ncbi:1,4-alpha-glucan branching protein GlgB [Streptomyces sp. GXMU-J5]|uniref:1,4-alpha-glucan branching enzyme GlgB n=1 Tax=Streptomyces beihaiensis TaxID=2984495 RepID=A0ABT3TPI1_9ACTN|nr:1,4-alpha-glucan branching protein GlgB [Streptomyces beihaiensis]MCX3058680.1 1,4-alpha-glucan branching protein GlgB [Streptomyces beihaiensis]
MPATATTAVTGLHDADLDRILAGAHHDPHGLLGAHRTGDGRTVVRALKPLAHSVVAVRDTGERAELVHQRDGLFAGTLPGEGPYHFLVDYGDGRALLHHDGYRFPPTLGEIDLHLISEGRHELLWRVLGSHVRTLDGVTGTSFAVWAPNAQGVRVMGDFNGWDGVAHPLRSLGSSGVWELFVPGVAAGTRYKYEIHTRDGRLLQKADPLARATEPPPATASVVHVSTYDWRDARWMARRGGEDCHARPMSVYEVHLPSWRPGLTYRELADELPAYVARLGFTHIELMPVMEHPFGGSWGYQVTGFYAPTARLGDPDDLRCLVDAFHAAGIGVILDWVPAHFPKDDFALSQFDGEPLYEPSDPRRAHHPDWGTLEFDHGRREVRNFLVASAVYWCTEFHVDALRVDAVASLLYLDYSRPPGGWSPNEHGGHENLDAVAFLQELTDTVRRTAPGALTIAEESTSWPGVTRPTYEVGEDGFGGLGFDLKWNLGWMHDTLRYLAREPVHRAWHQDDITFAMVYAYSEHFLLPLSHDEVVHGKGALVAKSPGDWWQRRATLRALYAFMWSHPGKQLIFMGQEFGQGDEFDHDAGPQWWVLDDDWPAHADHRGIRRLVRDLNRRYLATPALWQLDADPAGFAWIDASHAEANVVSFVRRDADGRPLVVVANFSPVVRTGYRVGLPGAARRWREVLNTDAAEYGGGGVCAPGPIRAEPTAWHGHDRSAALTLPPLGVVWLHPVGEEAEEPVRDKNEYECECEDEGEEDDDA